MNFNLLGGNINNFNNSLNNLENIGTRLSDFVPIENSEKPYSILGKGNYGYVEKMRSLKNNNIYAIKKLDKNDNKFDEIYFLRETENMITLNHPNIAKLYGYFLDYENIIKFTQIYQKEISSGKKLVNFQFQYVEIYCLVLEYVENGSLENFNKKYKEIYLYTTNYVPIEQAFILKIFKQLISALNYLNNKSIMHRDIKPDNILLDKNYDIKISDFGISALFMDQNPENINKDINLFSEFTQIGRPDFTSPEILNDSHFYDYRVDIFSLGLTILCLMSKDNPIQIKKVGNKYERKININSIPNSYNSYLVKLVLRMINENMNLRPFSNQVYEELIDIEEYIKNPKNNILKNKLDKFNEPKYQFTKNLVNNNNNINFQNVQNNLNIPNFNIQNIQNIQNFQNPQINQSNPNLQGPQGDNNIFPNKNIIPNQTDWNQNIKQQNNIGQNNNINSNEKKFYLNNIYNNQNIIQNEIDYFKEPKIKTKNTSLIRVFQCLYSIIKNSINNIRDIIKNINVPNQNNLITLDILNIIEYIGLNSSEDSEDNEDINEKKFINYVQNFRNNLTIRINEFKNVFNGKGEINPKLVISLFFLTMNNEFLKNNIISNNKIFEKLNNFKNISRKSFPEIDNINIDNFKKKYNFPLVDDFFFINIQIIKCQKCNSILKFASEINYLIQLPISEEGKISDLIERYMLSSNDNELINNKCNKCFENGIIKCENHFLNSPNYLIICFEGKNKAYKNLNKIDLTQFIISDIGPKNFYLYSFIAQDDDEKYKAYIKKDDEWYLYFNENEVEPTREKSFNYCFPYVAIYKGE